MLSALAGLDSVQVLGFGVWGSRLWGSSGCREKPQGLKLGA